MEKIKTFTIALLFSFIGITMPSAYADTWTQKANYGGTASNAQVGLSIGEKGYVWERSTKLFWEYDPVADTWTQKANFSGTLTTDVVAFSIGSKGYLGTGLSSSEYKAEFWEYDPATGDSGTWTQKADFGGEIRKNAVGFSIGTKGYIGTGSHQTSYFKDFWEFDPSSGADGAWAAVTNFGGIERNYAVGFSIGTKGYIGTGTDGSSYYKDLWEYDSGTGAWTQKADFGGIERYRAVGFAIGDYGYVGLGYSSSGYKKDFWEYDPTLNTWTQKSDFTGMARYAASAFVIGSKAYVGAGYTGEYANDFWEYDPLGSITPGQFTFLDQTNVALSSVITSNTITVSGITASTSISITGGTYSINGGAYAGTAATVVNGDTVTVKLVSSASYSTTTNATLTIGGVSDTFSVTTQVGDSTPDQFTFKDKSNVALNTEYISDSITVSGIVVPAPISITGGTYSINSGSYTSTAGTVANGDTVTVKQTSSGSYSTTTNAVLTIGGVSDTFSVTTKAESHGGGGGGGGCFIATAAFGSPLAGQVEILRQFRDRYLLTNAPGKKFVSWYYENGPVAANWIKDKPLAKAAVQAALYPLIGFSFLLITGYLPLALLGLLLSVFFCLRLKQRKLSAG